MKKLIQYFNFNSNSSLFTLELVEVEPNDDNELHKHLVMLWFSSSEGITRLQFNEFDKLKDAVHQYNSIGVTLGQTAMCLSKPMLSIPKEVRTLNFF